MTNGEFIDYEGYSIRTQKTSVKGKDYQRLVVDFGSNGSGKRIRRSFSTEAKAKAGIRAHIQKQKKDNSTQEVLQKRIGEKADKLTTDNLIDAAAALGILGGSVTLATAAEYFMQHNHPKGGKRTVDDVISGYVAEAESDGLRSASIQDMKNRLGRFSAAFGKTPIHEIGRVKVLEWSRGKHTAKRDGEAISPLTRKHYLTVIGGLFNYALENDLITENPLAKKSTRRRKASGMADEIMPEIITVAEVTAVMLAAQEHDSSMVPALAIGFFAGVRTSELQQLEWQHVNLVEKRLTISPAIAKKRSVRHIDISDNLAAWLAPYAQKSGLVAPDSTAWRHRFDKVRDHAEIDRWPHNAMRHCFATYYLAKTDDANKTALQLGHRDTNLLFKHYRGLATREDAAAFWAITPKAEDEGVIQYRNQKAS